MILLYIFLLIDHINHIDCSCESTSIAVWVCASAKFAVQHCSSLHSRRKATWHRVNCQTMVRNHCWGLVLRRFRVCPKMTYHKQRVQMLSCTGQPSGFSYLLCSIVCVFPKTKNKLRYISCCCCCWCCYDLLTSRRNNRPPGTLLEDKTVCLVTKNDKDKSFGLNGWGASFTVWPLHDGTTDSFASAPPAVTKRFKSTSDIRKHMSFAASSKVFAIVIEQYNSKGVHTFEISNTKLRVGFGRADYKLVPPSSHSREDVAKLFKQPVVAAPSSPPKDT